MHETLNRRDLIKTTASLTVLFLAEDLQAQDTGQKSGTGPPVRIGLIGVGQWGKQILETVSRCSAIQVTAIADSYPAALTKGKEIAPGAATFTDYRQLIESPSVEAVIVATPTPSHRSIVLDAIQADKHVYCEAPLATSVDDARAIALAASKAPKLKVQSGLQGRSNPLYRHIDKFVKSGVLGTPAQVTAQWNKKDSWRRMAATPAREQDLNWRLAKATSGGLIGEIGVHQIDLVNWYLKGLPIAVGGHSSLLQWKDGRDVPDTVQCILEYPNDVRLTFTSTLVSSFSESFTAFEGSNSSLLLRERRGWLIKEADSPLLGWEVYARKESVHNETGIAMIADATKILAEGKDPGKDGPVEPTQTALYLALEAFAQAVRTGGEVASSVLEGYVATVTAIKTNEAALAGARIPIDPSLFELK